MLNARGRPCTHIFPIPFNLLYGLNRQIAIILDRCLSYVITGLKTIWWIFVGQAISNNNILNGVLIVGRLDDEHGGFEVFCQVSSIIAVIIFIFEFLQALRNGKSNPLILNKLKEVCRCHFDGLNSSKRREKLSYEEPTIRKRINFCFFCVFNQVIRIEVSGYSSRGYSCNHDTLPIVEVKLGVEVAKLLHCVVVSSEVELLIFVGYWLSPASCVL